MSGGFDSRLTFLLLLKSNVDLQKIRVNSIKDKLHTHAEDFRIATSIAKDLGFELNRHPLDSRCTHFGLEDILNISLYPKLGLHKEMYFQYGKRVRPSFTIPGMGGEGLRSHWNMTPVDFINQNAKLCKKYSNTLSHIVENSIKRVLKNSCKYVAIKNHISEWETDKDLLPLLYSEGRNRNHFGKECIENYFAGNYMITPLMDPLIQKLKLHDEKCLDTNLLVALIFERYAPELLEFPFQGRRRISNETLQYAKSLNDLYPFNRKSNIPKYSIDFYLPKFAPLKPTENHNKIINYGVPEKFLYHIFNSVYFRSYFDSYFKDEFWISANITTKFSKYFPLRHCYSIITAVKVLEAVQTSISLPNFTLMKDLNGYIGKPSARTHPLLYPLLNHFLLLAKKGKRKLWKSVRMILLKVSQKT